MKYENYLFQQQERFKPEIKKRYYDTLIDPEIPVQDDDIYILTQIGDRLDLIAYHYYSNSSLWTIIATANPELRQDSVYLEPGLQLRIPRDSNKYLQLLQDINNAR